MIKKSTDDKYDRKNVSIVLKKTSHQYMSRPFGNCSDYQIPDKTTYQSMSYMECYRKCLTYQYIKSWECVPYLMDNFITEYDVINDETKRCSTKRVETKDVNRKFDENNFVEKCLKICPKDCFQVEFPSKVYIRESYFNNQDWVDEEGANLYNGPYERVIVWDSHQPMFAYIDEPVLTFTQYLVFCGGLMGLWFGQSLKDMFSLLIDKHFWHSIHRKITMILILTKECMFIVYKLTCKLLLFLIKFVIVYLNFVISKISQLVLR